MQSSKVGTTSATRPTVRLGIDASSNPPSELQHHPGARVPVVELRVARSEPHRISTLDEVPSRCRRSSAGTGLLHRTPTRPHGAKRDAGVIFLPWQSVRFWTLRVAAEVQPDEPADKTPSRRGRAATRPIQNLPDPPIAATATYTEADLPAPGMESQMDFAGSPLTTAFESMAPDENTMTRRRRFAVEAFKHPIAISGGGPYLFPSDLNPPGYQVTFKTAWEATLSRAKVPCLPHLRLTLGLRDTFQCGRRRERVGRSTPSSRRCEGLQEVLADSTADEARGAPEDEPLRQRRRGRCEWRISREFFDSPESFREFFDSFSTVRAALRAGQLGCRWRTQ
jgi:hypothetical protein